MGVPSPHRLPPAAPFHPIPGLSGPPGHCCLLWRGAERRHTRAGQHAPRRHGLSLCPPTYPFGFCYCLPAPAGGYGCGRWLLLPAHPLLPAYLLLPAHPLLPACLQADVGVDAGCYCLPIPYCPPTCACYCLPAGGRGCGRWLLRSPDHGLCQGGGGRAVGCGGSGRVRGGH